MKIAQSLLNAGIVYKKQGIYDKAISLLLEAVKYFEKNGNEKQISSCYNTIANIQNDMGYFDDALDYHFKALQIRQNIRYKNGIAGSLNNIGSIYKNLDSLKTALDYYSSSLAIKYALGDKKLIASTLSNIGEVYVMMSEYDKAESNFKESLMLRKQIGDQNGILSVSNKISELYLKNGQLEKAEQYLNLGNTIAQRINSNELAMNNYKLMAELYVKKGKLNSAINNFIIYDSLKILVYDSEKIKALTDLRIKYETENKEKEIFSLNKIQKIQKEKLQAQNKMLISLIFGTLMLFSLTLIIYRGFKLKQRSNLQIKLLMQERQHRAKNNLQIISELLGLQSGYLTNQDAIGAIESSKSRMQAVSLIDKLLYQNPDNTEINMSEYIQKLVENLVLLFGNRKIKIKLEIQKLLLDANIATPLGLILNELVTNSLKYAFLNLSDPEMVLKLKRNEQKEILFEYKDNGPGIPANYDLAKSKTLGLKLIHSLSKQLKGQFHIKNENGFTYSLVFKQ